MRGRGRSGGFFLCALFAVIGSFIGGLAGQALGGSSATSIGVGAVLGGVLACVVEALGFGPGPKRTAYANPSGVAVTQPDHGEPAKTLK
jgi:hypothetical protein